MLPDVDARGCWSHLRAGDERQIAARFRLALCASHRCRRSGSLLPAHRLRIRARPNPCGSTARPLLIEPLDNRCWRWTNGGSRNRTALAVRITPAAQQRMLIVVDHLIFVPPVHPFAPPTRILPSFSLSTAPLTEIEMSAEPAPPARAINELRAANWRKILRDENRANQSWSEPHSSGRASETAGARREHSSAGEPAGKQAGRRFGRLQPSA